MHCLILGRTLSGKTTWAKKKLQALKKLHPDRHSIVLDPILDPSWQADFITNDQEEFLQAFWNNKNCNVFIDESGDIGKFNTAMDKTATRGRHWGHKIYFICQRAKMVSTTVRTQCSELVIFKNSFDDTKDLAREFVEPMINEAHSLNDGEFIYVRKGSKPIKLNVFDLK